MNRPHISVADLLGAVLICAFGLASLKYPTLLTAGALGTLLYGSLAVATVGALLRRGPRRAFWIGFAICGGAYSLLAFEITNSHPQLLTVDLLVIVKALLNGQPAATFAWLAKVHTDQWELFAQIGNSWFGLVAGVLGGRLGRHFAATEREGSV